MSKSISTPVKLQRDSQNLSQHRTSRAETRPKQLTNNSAGLSNRELGQRFNVAKSNWQQREIHNNRKFFQAVKKLLKKANQPQTPSQRIQTVKTIKLTRLISLNPEFTNNDYQNLRVLVQGDSRTRQIVNEYYQSHRRMIKIKYRIVNLHSIKIIAKVSHPLIYDHVLKLSPNFSKLIYGAELNLINQIDGVYNDWIYRERLMLKPDLESQHPDIHVTYRLPIDTNVIVRKISPINVEAKINDYRLLKKWINSKQFSQKYRQIIRKFNPVIKNNSKAKILRPNLIMIKIKVPKGKYFIRYRSDRLEDPDVFAIEFAILRKNRFRIKPLIRALEDCVYFGSNRPISIDPINQLIGKKTGIQFEKFTVKLLYRLGYHHVKHIGKPKDYGVDIIAKRHGITYGFQCKHHNRLESKKKAEIRYGDIEEIKCGIAYYHVNCGVLVTNNGYKFFTKYAKHGAKKVGIQLWDRQKLKQLVKEANQMCIK